jgi:hypothetical protein
MARAAAPRMPAALVAWGAPPVNVDATAAADDFADAAALVAEPAADEALDAAEAATDEAAAAADEIAAEAELATLEAAAALEETADATAEERAALALATADEAEACAPGMLMGTPASWHVFWTAAMVEACSAAGHAPWTQGCTVARRVAPFWQWHLKSVRDEQPSVERGVIKQLNYKILVVVVEG